MKRYISLIAVIGAAFVFMGSLVLPAQARLTNSSSDTPEKLKFRESCYATKVAALQAELQAKRFDIGVFLSKKSAAYNECADEARKMDVPDAPADKTSPQIPPNTVEQKTDATATVQKYRTRFYEKCMDIYRNDARVGACCSAQADAETSALERKGAFDTETTAELPVFVDESKCSIPKEVVPDSRCDTYEGDKHRECSDYIKRCLDAGRYAYLSENGRAERCAIDFAQGSTIALSTQEKYAKICIAAGVARGESEDDLKGSCLADYLYAAREYRDRCLAMLNRVEYSKSTTLILRLRTLFNPARFHQQTKECMAKYDTALSNMTP